MKKVFVAMSGGVDSSVTAALLKDQGYDVTGVFMKFWSPAGKETSFCLWKKEREDALRVATILDIPLLTWDFTKEYEDKVVDYMIDAYRHGITPNPDLMCNKEIKFGMFFNKALAEGADFVATGHYARIARAGQLISKSANQPRCHCPTEGTLGGSSSGGRGNLCFCRNRLRSLSRVKRGISAPRNDNIVEYQLLKAKDLNKDQSYFLYNLNQKHLEKTLFPIGEYTKPKVRDLAKKYGLPTAEKKDSQGICFIGPLKVREFLKERIKPKKGEIIKISKSANQLISKSVIKSDMLTRRSSRRVPFGADSLVLATHDGVYYYTIGQRHGMDIKTGGGPYFVIDKDIKKNILYVGDKKDLFSDKAIVSDITWIGETPILPAKIEVMIRYRSKPIRSVLKNNETIEQPASPVGGLNNNGLGFTKSDRYKHSLKLKFEKCAKAVTPGQAAVFYDGDRVLGGGTILG